MTPIHMVFRSVFRTPALLSQAPSSDVQGAVLQPSLLPTVEAWSTILLTVAVLGVLVALIAILMQLRGLTRSLGSVAKELEKDAAPVLDRARIVAENLEFITGAVRNDVQKVNESVSRLNDRLRKASDRMEERIQDFNALVEVLQEEAEELALDTAAAVRGVRAGTRKLAGNRSRLVEEAVGLAGAGEAGALPPDESEGGEPED